MEITQDMRDELKAARDIPGEFKFFGQVMSMRGLLQNNKYFNLFVPEATQELVEAFQKFTDSYDLQSEKWWPNWRQ